VCVCVRQTRVRQARGQGSGLRVRRVGQQAGARVRAGSARRWGARTRRAVFNAQAAKPVIQASASDTQTIESILRQTGVAGRQGIGRTTGGMGLLSHGMQEGKWQGHAVAVHVRAVAGVCVNAQRMQARPPSPSRHCSAPTTGTVWFVGPVWLPRLGLGGGGRLPALWGCGVRLQCCSHPTGRRVAATPAHGGGILGKHGFTFHHGSWVTTACPFCPVA